MVTTAARRNASAQAPYFPPSEAAAASRVSSRAGWGCCLIQFQKRGISNCPGKTEFRQRGQNSSRSDLRLLRSSDRPLRTAKFWPPGTVRNIRRFFLWFGQHPHLVREKDPAAAASDDGKGVAYADAFILKWGMSCNRKRMELWNRGNDGRLKYQIKDYYNSIAAN